MNEILTDGKYQRQEEHQQQQRRSLHKIGESTSVDVSGWYGFCFGSGEKQQIISPINLIFINEEDVVVASHRIPFRVSDQPIYSLHYGRLVYCKPGIRIQTMIVQENSSDPEKKSLPYDSTKLWYLVLRHAVSNDEYIGGELSIRDKCIVCAYCAPEKKKTFKSIEAADAHYHHSHRIYPADSIWTTPLEVCYQDDEDNDAVLVINKPQGIAVQGGEAGTNLSRSNLLVPFCTTKLSSNGRKHIKKPIIVHRLDAPTGGLLVLAKSKDAERRLKESFAQHRCLKRYRAVVYGNVISDHGVISEPIGGKQAETKYKVIRRTRSSCPHSEGWITTLDLYPVSGRKHQIRRHLKFIGHPIWGDRRYSYISSTTTNNVNNNGNDEALNHLPFSIEEEENKVDELHRTTVEQDPFIRLCLWAMEINFPHPTTDTMINVILPKEPIWISQLINYQEKLYYLEQANKRQKTNNNS